MREKFLRADACPTAVADGAGAEELLVLWSVGRNVGVPAFGPDASQWPARYWDAVDVFITESARLERALWDADHPQEDER